MRRIAIYIYETLLKCGVIFPGQSAVEANLQALYPGEKAELLRTTYYVNKIKLMLLLLVLGVFLGAMAKFCSAREAVVSDNILKRGTFETGSKEYVLQKVGADNESKFVLEVYSQELTQEQLNEYASYFFEHSGRYILGENKTLSEIQYDLNLLDEYDGLPFYIEWSSSDISIVDSSGHVSECVESLIVKLTAKLVYHEFEYEDVIEVEVIPPNRTENEQRDMELQNYLKVVEKSSRYDEEVVLPNEWNGEQVAWKLYVKDYSHFIWLATPLVLGIIYVSFDKDLSKQRENKRKELRRDYPGLIHKMVLYTGAGMSLRGAIQKICAEYEACRNTGKLRPGYEELLFTNREIKAGIAEGVAYERLGKRTNIREYIRLSTLMNQNLKHGDTTFQKKMEEEILTVSEEMLQQVRKLGEEAETKMLFPMVIMLGITMVMILIPAFGML